MAGSLDNSSSEKLRPRKRWWRFFYQFSLRTLLILTTLAAIACWWFLQPKSQEQQLAGNYLKLQHQFRLKKFENVNFKDPSGNQLSAAAFTLFVKTGYWRLRDQHHDLLVSGRYDNNQPHGKWTIYHTSGHKAAEGEVFRGARRGTWKTWDAAGRLLEEATFAAREQEHHWSKPLSPEMATYLPWQSVRRGPARAWHPSGQLKFEGQYEDDHRSGAWTFYDNQGRVTSRRDYIAETAKSRPEAQGRREEEQKE